MSRAAGSPSPAAGWPRCLPLCPDRPVNVDNGAVRKARGFGEIQAKRPGQIPEQRQSVPQDDRRDDQAVLVDQAKPGMTVLGQWRLLPIMAGMSTASPTPSPLRSETTAHAAPTCVV